MSETALPGRILVTGGAGFIGSHVCDALVEAGVQVTCLDDLSTGRQSNLTHLEGHALFTFRHGDIRDPGCCREAVSGVDAVVHLAALGSVPRSIADPLATEGANLAGFLNMLEACRATGIKRLVYASSSSVYGDSTALPKREGSEGVPLSPYAVTKAMDEAYAGLYRHLFQLEVIGLRFFNVFGERQDPNGPYAAAIPRFVQALMEHRPPQVHGDGRQSRDFTYVANAVQAVVCALGARDERAFGGVFNIAYGERTDLLELIAMLRAEVARIDPRAADVSVEFLPPRPGDVRDSLADGTRALEVLGFKPGWSVAQGMSRTVAWYAGHSA